MGPTLSKVPWLEYGDGRLLDLPNQRLDPIGAVEETELRMGGDTAERHGKPCWEFVVKT